MARSVWLALLLISLVASPVHAAIKIRVIIVDPPESSFVLAARAFKAQVEKETRGTLSIEVLPSGRWNGRNLSELDILKSVRAGEPEMGIVTTAPMANYSKSLEILDTPFLFNDYSHVDKTLDGPVGKKLLDSMIPQGLRGLAFLDSGFRIFTSTRPLNRYDDFKGLRVRVMQNPVYINFIKLVGAVPVPAPVDKIYEMARKGYIDAADRSYPTYWTFKLYEVQKHILETNHAYAAKAFIINEAFYRKLSESQRKIVADAAYACRIEQRKRFREDMLEVKQRCQKQGITIVKMTDSDRQRMRDACKPIYDQISHQIDPELIKEITAAH